MTMADYAVGMKNPALSPDNQQPDGLTTAAPDDAMCASAGREAADDQRPADPVQSTSDLTHHDGSFYEIVNNNVTFALLPPL